MNKLEWLVQIADKKPLLFSIVLLLLALGYVVRDDSVTHKNIDECNLYKDSIRKDYEKKLDSIVGYYNSREISLQNEVKESLGNIIETYKQQLNSQKELNDRIKSTIKSNKKIIKTLANGN